MIPRGSVEIRPRGTVATSSAAAPPTPGASAVKNEGLRERHLAPVRSPCFVSTAG